MNHGAAETRSQAKADWPQRGAKVVRPAGGGGIEERLKRQKEETGGGKEERRGAEKKKGRNGRKKKPRLNSGLSSARSAAPRELVWIEPKAEAHAKARRREATPPFSRSSRLRVRPLHWARRWPRLRATAATCRVDFPRDSKRPGIPEDQSLGRFESVGAQGFRPRRSPPRVFLRPQPEN
jgi:hypothetical protein